MGGWRGFSIIRDLANVPKPFNVGAGLGGLANLRVSGQRLKHALILGHRRPGQFGRLGRHVQRSHQAFDRGEIQL